MCVPSVQSRNWKLSQALTSVNSDTKFIVVGPIIVIVTFAYAADCRHEDKLCAGHDDDIRPIIFVLTLN